MLYDHIDFSSKLQLSIIRCGATSSSSIWIFLDLIICLTFGIVFKVPSVCGETFLFFKFSFLLTHVSGIALTTAKISMATDIQCPHTNSCCFFSDLGEFTTSQLYSLADMITSGQILARINFRCKPSFFTVVSEFTLTLTFAITRLRIAIKVFCGGL